MRMLKVSLLLAAALTVASGANFSGKWALPNAGRGGPMFLVLNQVGNDVTGNILAGGGSIGSGAPANSEILDGKANGDSISFYLWTGNDQPVKTMYKGTMSAAGDEIKFTVTRGPGGFVPTQGGGAQSGGAGRAGNTGPQEITAKRAK